MNILTGSHSSAPYYESSASVSTTKTEESVKRAVTRLMEEKDSDGNYIVSDQCQFYAIKAVLINLCGFPSKPAEFNKVLHNLELDKLRIPYVYDSVRKIHPHQLPQNVELWRQYQNCEDDYSRKQVVPAVRLMDILKEESQ
ncbi:MAG: hypothetical protein K6D59_05615 [Bacteroidales bacterium]|nr:hypothetical protein [Bacteroidales bacterium]